MTYEDNIMLTYLSSCEELQEMMVVASLKFQHHCYIPKFSGAYQIENYRPIVLANYQLKLGLNITSRLSIYPFTKKTFKTNLANIKCF